jgi:hypothetical protein
MSDGLPILMKYQMAAEYELAHAWQPMPPPKEGNYLVTCLITDEARGVEMRSVGLDWFDGERWPRQGGYTKYVAWRVVPEPCLNSMEPRHFP